MPKFVFLKIYLLLIYSFGKKEEIFLDDTITVAYNFEAVNLSQPRCQLDQSIISDFYTFLDLHKNKIAIGRLTELA